MEKKDEKIICKDCGKEFIFTIGEQEFYEEKGFTNKPVRCKDCRNAKKNTSNRRSFNDDRRF
ncbi:MAG: zinc-ribbon domain-containing protein [Bacilli bacterium]|nr:zinc-ribbon domain-containing protein [Bacilli bacterium]